MNGFAYNGVHSSAFHCFYVPNATARGNDMEEYSVTSQETDGRDGGYYAGNRVEARELAQECFFEDITAAAREGLQNWLHRNTAGKLVLDRRPYVSYDVVPSKRVVLSQYMHLAADGTLLFSGTFTATFKCFDPFGEMTVTAIELGDAADYSGTGLLPRIMMPLSPTPTSRNFLVYNPGTERADTVIRLAGDAGSGMEIYNATTDQRCRIVNLRANSIPTGAYLNIDSRKGQVLVHKGDDTEQAYQYHDLGYVQLAPCLPLTSGVQIAHTSGQKEIRSDGRFLPHMAGQYVHLGGWKRIHRIESADVAHLAENAAVAGTTETPVVTMNEMYIEGAGIDLSRLEVAYTPRTR